jgi:hypothetical protein
LTQALRGRTIPEQDRKALPTLWGLLVADLEQVSAEERANWAADRRSQEVRDFLDGGPGGRYPDEAAELLSALGGADLSGSGDDDLSGFVPPEPPSRGGPDGPGEVAYPVLAAEAVVQCVDRDPPNYGHVVSDHGDTAAVRFRSESGHVTTKVLPKAVLRRQDGSPLEEIDELPDGPVTICLAGVAPRQVEWLWPRRVPLGKLTIFAGPGGLGKTFVCTDMIARVTQGDAWPDSPGAPNPVGSSLFVTTEDDPADTIVPRLIAAGADLNRVHVLAPEVLSRFGV